MPLLDPEVLRNLGENPSYYEFIRDHFPMGEPMDMELQPDAATLGKTERRRLIFLVERRGQDEWFGVPDYPDRACTTDELFLYMNQYLKDSFITFSLGEDPRLVKRERVQRGEEPESIRFFSIHEAIDLLKADEYILD